MFAPAPSAASTTTSTHAVRASWFCTQGIAEAAFCTPEETDTATVDPVLTIADVHRLVVAARTVHMAPALQGYLVDLVTTGKAALETALDQLVLELFAVLAPGVLARSDSLVHVCTYRLNAHIQA